MNRSIRSTLLVGLLVLTAGFSVRAQRDAYSEAEPVYLALMTHMERNTDYANDVIYDRHVCRIEAALELLGDAKLTLESEKSFAIADAERGDASLMRKLLDLGHGVATHCDLLNEQNPSDAFRRNKELVDAVVGSENNKGCSGGASLQEDWVLAAMEGGFCYLNGIVGAHYLTMDASARPPGAGWQDWDTLRDPNQPYFKKASPLPMKRRIHPFLLENADDFEPDTGDAGELLLIMSGLLGGIDRQYEFRERFEVPLPPCCGSESDESEDCTKSRDCRLLEQQKLGCDGVGRLAKCEFTNDDIAIALRKIEQALAAHAGSSEPAKIEFHFPLRVFKLKDDSGACSASNLLYKTQLKKFIRQVERRFMSDAIPQLRWATQLEAFDAFEGQSDWICPRGLNMPDALAVGLPFEPFALPIGLSRLHLGAFEDPIGTSTAARKFGSEQQQRLDAHRLGAKILRRIGNRDLTWQALSRGAAVPVDKSEVVGLIATPDNEQALTTLLQWLHDNQKRVVFTLFAYGSREVPDQAVGASHWQDPEVMESLKLPWDEAHHAGKLAPDRTTEADRYDYLDIRSGYQLMYLEFMAEGIATLLNSIDDQLEFPIEDTIHALELFSGVDDRNVHFENEKYWAGDASTSGEKWGVAYQRVARTLRDNLDAPLRLWLPGMTSHYETTKGTSSTRTRNSFEYKKDFLDEMLKNISAKAAAQAELSDLVDGMNYDFDHRNALADRVLLGEDDTRTKRLGPLEMYVLRDELEELREIFAQHSLEDIELTVLATGVSTIDRDELVPDWVASGDREWLQAYEVWRRLGGALGAGADAAGWDAWMSEEWTESLDDFRKENYGMGLREDWFSVDDPASNAIQRPSWYAYRRFTELFGMMTSAELIHPPLGSTPGWGIHIVEFRTSMAPDRYGYLVFLDTATTKPAYGARSDHEVVFQLEWADDGPLPRSARREFIEPNGTVPSSGSGSSGSSTELVLPFEDKTYPDDEELVLPTTLIFRPGDPPLVVLATGAIDWRFSARSVLPE